MFWRFGGYANISTLDSILDKPDVTLEELLDESDLIQELKAQNAKLIDFLREERTLEKILQYVLADKPPEPSVEEKTEEEENKTTGGFFKTRMARSQSRGTGELEEDKQEMKRTKYAFVSCEILSSEVYSIYESLLAMPDALREFWQFIKRPAPLDAIQAGYFTKVNEALLEKKTEEMIAFIKTIDNVVVDMMRHVDCPVIMDLLLKLISLEKEPEGQGVIDWLQSQNLMPMLLSYITPDHSAATQTSAGDFLKAVITISANAQGQDATVIGPNELTRQLVSESCVKCLIREMLKGGNPLTVGVGIVIEVIRKNNSDYDTEGVGPDPKSSDPIYLGTLLRLFSTYIADFMDLILSPRHTIQTESGSATVDRKDLKVAWGDRIEPLGFDRFKTCELMAELLHCSNMGLLNERGSEAMVKARDEERERLKAEGKLSTIVGKPAQAAFGTSVDSSDFHHAETCTPLGESPESVKRLEVQNANGDEEEFEKVAISEALPENSDHQSTEKDSSNPARVDDKAFSHTQSGVDDQVADLDLEEESEPYPSQPAEGHPPRTSSKHPVSLLTQQLQAAQETALSENSGLNATANLPEAPAPLFADRAKDTTLSRPQDSQTSDAHLPQEGEPGDVEIREDFPRDEPIDPQQLPIIETEEDGSPVVGDLLKIKFVENRVVPTILDFFFRFPWNNFLHNVVYDVVQQVFNGSMDRGFNRNLAIDLFETGRITDRVIEGQQHSDEMQTERKMRLGYMGHLTLIAEEIVKFTERQPAELLAPVVVSQVTGTGWINYVEHTLEETRQKDNAVLGGIRPDAVGGPRQAVLNAVNAAQGGLSGPTSAALANAGLSGGGTQGLDGMDLATAGGSNNNYGLGGGSLLSGFGSSDDEDEEDFEEGEATESGETSHRPIHDEEQTNDPSDISDPPSDSHQATNSTSPTSSSVPAPLAIPPSRARRQLAARLAEKQRLANMGDVPEGELRSAPGQSAIAAAIATSAVTAAAPASTLASHQFVKQSKETYRSTSEGTESAARAHSSEDDDDEDDDDDLLSSSDEEERVPQTTREASREERRPIDGSSSSSSSDEEDDDIRNRPQAPPPLSPLRKSHTSTGNLQTPHLSGTEKQKLAEKEELNKREKEARTEQDVEDINADNDLEVEDYWRLGELRQAAAQRAALVARSNSRGGGSSGSLATQAGLSSHSPVKHRKKTSQDTRRREQEKLLLAGGIAEREPPGDDEEDEEDMGVQMGSKFLPKRSSLGGGSSRK